jgi:hypothetical protein
MPSNVAITTKIAKTKNMKKNILEILVAPDSMPLNPSKPATTAIMKNTIA